MAYVPMCIIDGLHNRATMADEITLIAAAKKNQKRQRQDCGFDCCNGRDN